MFRWGVTKNISTAFYIIVLIILIINCSEMETKWSRKFDVLGPGDYRINSLSGSEKEIYLTGTYIDDKHASRCFTARYDPDGSLKWYKIYEAPNIEQAEGVAILVIKTQEELLTTRSDIYVLAETRNAAGDEKVILVRYDSLGNVQWQRKVTEHNGSIMGTLLSDHQGNLYVAGWETAADNRSTLYIGEYTESGETSWFTKYYNEEIAFEILKFDIMEPDYFVVAGLLKNTNEFFYMKYDSAGQFQKLILSETENRITLLSDLKVDPTGNVFLTGAIRNPETGDDFMIVAYNKEDSLLWFKEYDGEAHGHDVGELISIDELSNLYITGTSEDARGMATIVTMKYDLTGNHIWTQNLKQEEAVEPLFMEPRYLRLGKRPYIQHLYVAGTIGNDALIARCNTNGFYSWHKRQSTRRKVTRPTALSPDYFALECAANGRADAQLIKYGPSVILGLTRWD